MSVTAAPPEGATRSASSHDALLRTVLSVVTNATVLTALLVYFGWKRSDVQARQLGLDETIFALSTRDYLLRSVDALFVPLGVAAALGLAWLWFDARLRHRLDDPTVWPIVQRGVGVLRWSWLALPVAAFLVGSVVARLGTPIVGLVVWPLSFGAGLLLTAYAVHVRRLLDRHRRRAEPTPAWHPGLARGLVSLLVLLSVFWTLTNVAILRGVALADEVEAAIGSRPGVVVHSSRPLGIDAPGVSEERLGLEAFRYRGLRLLHHHETTFLLVHDGWTRDDGVMLVLHDDPGLRFEIVTGRG